MSKTESEFRLLPPNVQHDIEMQLYAEFNTLYAQLEQYGEDRIGISETELKRAETQRKRQLMKEWLRKDTVYTADNAIPIEYARKWAKENYSDDIDYLIRDWRKENADI